MSEVAGGAGVTPSLPFSPEDLAATGRVLAALAKDEALFFSKAAQPVRRAIAPLTKWQMGKMYSGGTPDEYRSALEKRKTRNAQKQQRQQFDRAYLAKTQLRAGRMQQLMQLAEKAGEHDVALPLVPDGAVDAPAVGAPVMLLDADSHTTHSDTSMAGASTIISDDAERAEAADPVGGTKRSALEAGLPMLSAESVKLQRFRACYICKARYRELHHFYDTLCPSCAALNWRKRHQQADLRGRVALVTGARVKIGFMCVLKLLRAGACVIATTRFPHDAAKRYVAQPDYADWCDRLHLFGLDFRLISSLEAFCAMLLQKYPRLDIIINNACQTVRRPPAYFKHLIEAEQAPVEALPSSAQPLVAEYHTFLKSTGVRQLTASSSSGMLEDKSAPREEAAFSAVVGGVEERGHATPGEAPITSAMASQVALLQEDAQIDRTLFPKGLTDVNAQQIDLRTTNSWIQRMHEISTPELAEVFAINAMAPFIINARLKPLMLKGRELPADWTPSRDYEPASLHGYSTLAESVLQSTGAAGSDVKSGKGGPSATIKNQARLLGEISPAVPVDWCRFIVNVSAMEGKFNRSKLPTHPHTNMAKAALNMMTRTSAQDYANDMIFMTAVDTGWINDENPLERAAKTASLQHFQTPIDEIDAAARILDPVFSPLVDATSGGTSGEEGKAPHCRPLFGAFLKDYFITEW